MKSSNIFILGLHGKHVGDTNTRVYLAAMNKYDGPLYQFVGDLIRQKREQAGLNQTALAKRISISRVSIVNIEHGRQRPPLHVLWKLAEALKVQLRDLIPLSLSEQNDSGIGTNESPELNKIQDWDAKDQQFVKSILQRAGQRK